MTPLRERLYSRLVPDPETGCLLWTGTTDRYGYGRISVNGEMQRVHNVAWELENGTVPDGLLLDHVKARGCAYRHCANIAHLEPVTSRENSMRGDTVQALNAAKTHCLHGHQFDAMNTYRYPGGRRNCRTCHNERERQRRSAARNQAAERAA